MGMQATQRPFFPVRNSSLFVLALSVALLLVSARLSAADDYLEAGEITAISAGTAGVLLLGEQFRHFDTSRSTLIKGPLPLEASLQRLLGGRYAPTKTNFLDNPFGDVITPAVSGLALLSVDLSWPEGDHSKFLLQDMFLFCAGALANTGLTNIVKGLVARPRPYVALYPDEPPQRPGSEPAFSRRSFYSGHASSAFFATTYLNKRIRATMKREMSPGDYRDWRWAPPVALYGWSTFVAWSRIQAYRHYVSDVVVGALAGCLVAEFFFSLNDSSDEERGSTDRPPILLRISVPL